MKKILSILLILTFVISLTSCGNAFDNLMEEINDKYGWEHIKPKDCYGTGLDKNIEKSCNLEFKGDILRSYVCSDYDSEKHNIVSIRIFEFENASDAKAFYRCMKERFDYAKRKGTVVVWGDMDLIGDLDF
jgi:hypothetical protein